MEHIIKFAKHVKIPPGYRIEWWDCDEMYHWVTDKDYSHPFCCRWMALRAAKRQAEIVGK